MTEEYIMGLMAGALRTALFVGAPCLLAGFVVGMIISLFQAVTQIHEATLTFIPKIVAIFLTLLWFGPRILASMIDFTRQMIISIPTVVQ
ncbi:MAG: flagellar biosynthetic protein FliQ [Deltaproteobacteria bacterium RIFOXYA12_FULL_61_11]|nr:MAG: flagellar biosynthetic protein FliQ [Deltaproteobacteria bacterium RIFOXYA12_FULL_61_11]